MDDSIDLRLFQYTLIGDAIKWYIKLDTALYNDFASLAQNFSTHFQWPTRYDIDSDLLLNLKQDHVTLIYDHIHEWCRHKRLVRTKLPDEILCKWFIRSL